MNDDDRIKSCAEREPARIDDSSKLPLQAIARGRAFEPMPCPQSDVGVGFVILEHPDGERGAPHPAAALLNGAEDAGPLQRARTGGSDRTALGRDELPAPLSSTTAQRSPSASGGHALQEPMHAHSLEV